MPLIIVPLFVTSLPFSLTDADCTIFKYVSNWTSVVVNVMLGVIMVTRLHAMYQRSRKMLVFLSVMFLVIHITSGVIAAILVKFVSFGEVDLSGIHMCASYYEEIPTIFLIEIIWILGFAWETLALSLAVWIAVKHFRELQRASTGWAVRDCFTILIQTHVFYFASFFVVSCLHIIEFFPDFFNLLSFTLTTLEIFQKFSLMVPIAQAMQMFVLGPRLILSIRDYQAKLVSNSDEGTAMTTIAFQERVQVSSGGSV